MFCCVCQPSTWKIMMGSCEMACRTRTKWSSKTTLCASRINFPFWRQWRAIALDVLQPGTMMLNFHPWTHSGAYWIFFSFAYKIKHWKKNAQKRLLNSEGQKWRHDKNSQAQRFLSSAVEMEATLDNSHSTFTLSTLLLHVSMNGLVGNVKVERPKCNSMTVELVSLYYSLGTHWKIEETLHVQYEFEVVLAASSNINLIMKKTLFW